MALKDELVRESHQKVSNVASETLEKIEIFAKNWLQLLLLLLRLVPPAAPAKHHATEERLLLLLLLLLLPLLHKDTATQPCRTGKHHGPGGRTSPKIPPKKCLTLLLKP